MGANWLAGVMEWTHWIALLSCVLLVGVCSKMVLDSSDRARPKHYVVHVSSESSDKESIKDHVSIEQMIGGKLPKHLLPGVRRQRVIAMLKASGFQMYNQETGEPVGSPEEYINDGLTYGVLSGGQKHL